MTPDAMATPVAASPLGPQSTRTTTHANALARSASTPQSTLYSHYTLTPPPPPSVAVLTVEQLGRLAHSVQSLAPLLQLNLVALAHTLSSLHPSDSLRAAVQASAIIAALPSAGVAALASTNTSHSIAGGGGIARLLSGLLWILEHTPSPASTSSSFEGDTLPSTPHPALLSTLLVVEQFAAQAALRSALLSGGAVRVLARVAVDAWATVDALRAETRAVLYSPVLGPAILPARLESARGLLSRTLDTLLAVTQAAPLAHGTSVPLAALLNRLGACVVAGPDDLREPSDQSTASGAAQPPHAFVQALSLLGNFVGHSPHAKAFVKSNPAVTSATASKESSTASHSTLLTAATSTTVTTIPLKSLYRRLISFLSSSSLALVLHALRLVSHLAVNDGAGGMERKLFAGANLESTFQLVFNLIMQNASAAFSSSSSAHGTTAAAQTGGELHLLRPAIEILLTLTQSASLLTSLKDYSQLAPSLKQLVRILHRASSSGGEDVVGGRASATAQVLELLLAFARSRPLAALVASLLRTDAETRETLCSQWFARDVHVASLAMRLVDAVIEVEEEERRSERTEGVISSTPLPIDADTLRGVARFLSRASFADAARADAEVERDSALVEAALREKDATADIATSVANFATPLSRQPSLASTSSSFSSSAPAATPAAARRNQTTHHSFLVLVSRFLTRRVSARVPLSALQIDANELQTSIVHLVRSSFSATPPSPSSTTTISPPTLRNEEAFALLRLLSRERAQAPNLHALLLSLPANEVATLLGASLAVCESDRRAAVRDALFVMRAWTDAHAARSTASTTHQGQVNGSAKKAPRSDAALDDEPPQLQTALDQLAEGLQSFHRLSSRDVHRLTASLASSRAQLASVSSSLADATASTRTALVAHSTREQALEARLKQVERECADQLEQKEHTIREIKAALASQSVHFESVLASRIHEYHAAHQAQLDRASVLEGDLVAAASRAETLERSLNDASTRHRATTEKLRRAGEEYEKSLAYSESLANENGALRERLAAVEADLRARDTKASTDEVEARERESQLQIRLEDAYAKLVLLNRAHQTASEEARTRDHQAREAQRRVDELSVEVSGLRSAHSSALDSLHASESRNVSLSRDVDSLTSEVSRLSSECSRRTSEFESLTRDHERLATRAQHATNEAHRLATAHARAQEQCAHLQTQLEAAETDLKQHHQLAAMIHKLSGQAHATKA